MLAALLPASTWIVLVGWLVVRPVSLPEAEVGVDQPIASTQNSTQPAESWSSFATSAFSEDTPPQEMVALPRRMPMRCETPNLEPLVTPETDNAGKAIAKITGLPLRWIMEPMDTAAKGMMLPIELATVENGPIHYSLRRLRFPDAEAKRLKLAITPLGHDDLAGVLKKMGLGSEYTTLAKEDLHSVDKLKQHDVVFLTCADVYAQDMQAARPLRRFVEQGGTIYASDLRADMLLAAFPELRASSPALPGVPQTIDAHVKDQGMQEHLGRRTIPLHFEASDWRPAPFESKKVTTLLRGTYRNNLGQVHSAPLLVKFRVKQGTVIFTSFHHTKNDSEIVTKLLDYLVFASVNARSEARVKEVMQRSNFTQQEMRQALLTAGKPVESVHEHSGGGLQVGLGFENLGARVKLTLRSPLGQTIEHEDQGLFVIDVPSAPAGSWRVTVTPVETPFANFPVVVAVGDGKS